MLLELPGPDGAGSLARWSLRAGRVASRSVVLNITDMVDDEYVLDIKDMADYEYMLDAVYTAACWSKRL